MLRSCARGSDECTGLCDDLSEYDGFEREVDVSGFDARDVEDFVDELEEIASSTGRMSSLTVIARNSAREKP